MIINSAPSEEMDEKYLEDQIDKLFDEDVQYVKGWVSEIDMISSVSHNTHAMLVYLLDELHSQGKLDFILLKNQSIAEFWAHVQKNRYREALHKSALDKMRSSFTAEELSILGIKLPNDVT